jgi:beta-glucanase (GH16 family)
MLKIKTTLLCAILFSLVQMIKAQIPNNDPLSWVTQSQSDDFGTSLSSKWWTENNMAGHGWSVQKTSNISFTATTLKIKVDTLIPSEYYAGSTYGTYYYQSGTVVSNLKDFKYGYLEIRAKYPTGHSAYWPAFWLWNDSCGNPGEWYNEIDIGENGSRDSKDGHRLGTNWWLPDADCGPEVGHLQTVYGLPLLDAAFHKYGLLWDPSGLYYYFDDVLVRTDLNGSAINHTMEVILGNGVQLDDTSGVWGDPLPYDPTAFPGYFEIDYFNYYKLNIDCGTNKTICTPGTDYSTRAVEKTILTGGVCSPTFNTSSQYTLRATDHVTLDAGTTINPDGSGHFMVLITPCPN